MAKSFHVRKGQTMIFEQVILFGISVAIFLILFSVFNIYQVVYTGIGNTNHLDEAREWISGNVLKVAEKSGNSTVTIPISRYIGDAVYEIRLEQTGLNLKNLITNEVKYSSLYGINLTYDLSGLTTSIKGKLTIKKEGSNIIIV